VLLKTAAREGLLAPITRWLIDDSYDEPIDNLIKNYVHNIKIIMQGQY
jgi:hypothetical protein